MKHITHHSASKGAAGNLSVDASPENISQWSSDVSTTHVAQIWENHRNSEEGKSLFSYPPRSPNWVCMSCLASLLSRLTVCGDPSM